MSNIIEALINIVENRDFKVKEYTKGNNRVQNMGEAFERYIFDAYCNSFHLKSKKKREKEYQKVFSFLGSKSKLPDAIVKNGEALEIKKSQESTVQLNSSYPKHTLKIDDPRIATKAKACEGTGKEQWKEKNIIYCFGNIQNKTKLLKSIWLVYGQVFCDLPEVYQDVAEQIEMSLDELHDDETITNELGRINSVDNLKITSLRIRGMWVIKHPQKVFSELTKDWKKSDFQVKALIPKSIYKEIPENSKNRLLSSDLKIEDVKISDPTNRANNVDSVFIYYK